MLPLELHSYHPAVDFCRLLWKGALNFYRPGLQQASSAAMPGAIILRLATSVEFSNAVAILGSSLFSPSMASVSVSLSPFAHLKRRRMMAMGQPLFSLNWPSPAERKSHHGTSASTWQMRLSSLR